MRSRRRRPAVAVVAGALVAVAGCSPAAERDAAAGVVHELYAAVDAGDGARACAVLAPSVVETVEDDEGTSCAQALTSGEAADALAERAPAGAVAVTRAGGQAQARTDHDTVFLAASGDGWVVTAAACDPRPSRPYACAVEGA